MYSTYITEDNFGYFAPIIPPDVQERADMLIGCLDDEDLACGVCGLMIDENVSFAKILWIYVSPESRRMGAADSMLHLVYEIAENLEVDHIEIEYFRTGETEVTYALFEGQGFLEADADECLHEYTAPIRSFKEKVPQTVKLSEGNKVVSLANTTANQWTVYDEFLEQLVEDGEPFVVPPLSKEQYHPEFSSVLLEGDKIVGCVMIAAEETAEGVIDVEYVRMEGGNVKNLLAVLSRSLYKMEKAYDEEKLLRMVAAGEDGEKLITGLCGKDAQIRTSTRQYYVM